VSLTRTADEVSLVCEEAALPPGVRHEGGWRAMKLHGPFELLLVGVLAAVLDPLRAAGVGVYAISTFDTDYVLVKDDQLAAAVDALVRAGRRVLEPAGPSDPAVANALDIIASNITTFGGDYPHDNTVDGVYSRRVPTFG